LKTDLIYLLSAIGLGPGGSSTVHIYTQTINKTTQLIWEECRPFPVFASYTLAFALQLRKKHGKTLVMVAEECHLARWRQNIQIILMIYSSSKSKTFEVEAPSVFGRKGNALDVNIHRNTLRNGAKSIFLSLTLVSASKYPSVHKPSLLSYAITYSI
jgi:hypothetical protein